ncbi:hypothetical protein ACLMJK_009392 [Lecanora helva]
MAVGSLVLIESVYDRVNKIQKLKRSRFDESDSYQELQPLGYGGNGNCFLLRRRSDQALRVCKVTHRFKQTEPREATILFKLLPRHDRIVQLHNLATYPKTFQLYFDYYSGGDLSNLIQRYAYDRLLPPESLLRHCLIQLVEALCFIHDGYDKRTNYNIQTTWTSIIHGDIKPENIFLRFPFRFSGTSYDRPSLVLGDFGSASLTASREAGTYRWQPPELPVTSKGADVWAVGAVVHAMAHDGRPPIDPLPAHVHNTYQNRLEWELCREARNPIPLHGRYSKRLHDCVFQALDLDPYTRSSALELELMVSWALRDHDILLGI